MSKSVLFYSNKCKHSLKAIELIKKNNININLVSIDNKNIKLPTFLKVVPTIIEEGSNSPLEGEFVFKWLQRFIKQDNHQANYQANYQSNPQANHQSNAQSNPQSKLQPISSQSNDSIQPFFSNEMSGYSDGYSYLNNENPMNHSYEFLNGVETSNQNKISSIETSSSSAKEDEFNQQYEQLMEKRRSEVPDAIQRS